MTQENQISILVVTHNHVEYIGQLLKSLIDFNVQNVFFCDAKSTDGTVEKLLKSPYKDNILLKEVLEGFSKNNNDLIRHFNLETRYYMLLNPDTYFDTNFIQVLYNFIKKDNTIGIVTPVLKYPNGDIQKTWKAFPNFINVVRKRLGLLKANNEIQMVGPNIDWCLGACMLIHNQFLKPNKTLLDERYRLYCEDIDICFEAHSRGLKVIGINQTYIYHHLNETSAKNIFSKYNVWNVSSIIKFIIKWNVQYFKKL
ncbi:glycosyltransferase [Formosa undariae]|uniref:Glycosyltransferase n=1 Tax=Formosa undariae TaxID=1325436 RepID=A0ABV5EXR2_9FLAO